MINKLILNNYRSFKNLELNINKNNVIIIGNNGVGKTTILESIYYVGITKSHKNIKDEDVIKFNEDFSKIEIIDEKKYKLVISKNGKKAFINNNEVKKLSDYIGNINTVMFTPDDLSLIKGSPIIKRRFLDIEISQINKDYLNTLALYKKLLKERNSLLKDNVDLKYLDVLDSSIIPLAKKIMEVRNEFIEKISDISNEIYNSISSGNELKLIYNPNSNIENMFKNIELDILTKVTNSGIHKDDITIKLNNKNARDFSSQGEIRTICLAIKIALVKYIRNKINKNPIILLDDVLSELDSIRQNKLFEVIKDLDVFITSTDLKNIKEELINKSQIFIIENNEIRELN